MIGSLTITNLESVLFIIKLQITVVFRIIE